MNMSATAAPRGWYTPDDCRLSDFRAVAEQTTDLADYPGADDVKSNVLVYGRKVPERAATGAGRRELQTELARALLEGPGIVVFAGAFGPAVVDRATEVFRAIIDDQHAAGAATGDHFAPPGNNDRIWGAVDKFALRAPGVFADYYSGDVLPLISEAWLGPGYQVTSQPNVVNPGGRAQVAHRDYHLGFMDREQAMGYPAHAHRLTPALTLQGAVAHCDMPVETGPTMYLPYSQKYEPGYVAFHSPEFTGYFNKHYVQLPLAKGDAVFFNPALFHGAGTNRSADVKRMANLLQISSAFGRAMDAVDTTATCAALFGTLKQRWAAGDEQAVRNLIAVAAEGYAFPTNLDRDQPVGRMTPVTQAELLAQAVREGWDDGQFRDELAAQQWRRTPDGGAR
jgi:ectoine hydroxylase-related dioxygenase (phytanoyl-CoA dioxygenase family)